MTDPNEQPAGPLTTADQGRRTHTGQGSAHATLQPNHAAGHGWSGVGSIAASAPHAADVAFVPHPQRKEPDGTARKTKTIAAKGGGIGASVDTVKTLLAEHPNVFEFCTGEAAKALIPVGRVPLERAQGGAVSDGRPSTRISLLREA